MFLKQHGFLNFPMIKGFNLCEPSAFAYNATERYSLFTLYPVRRLVASVRLGSNLQTYKISKFSDLIFFLFQEFTYKKVLFCPCYKFFQEDNWNNVLLIKVKH